MKEHLASIKDGAIIVGAILCALAGFALVAGSLVVAVMWGGWWTLSVFPALVLVCWFLGMINRSAGW